MVKNNYANMIYEQLEESVDVDSILFSVSNNVIKLSWKADKKVYYLDFYFLDSFYTIRVENDRHIPIEDICFLSQSKHFNKFIKKRLHQRKLDAKLFDNHLYVLLEIIKNELQNQNISDIKKIYNRDMKFNGIFL